MIALSCHASCIADKYMISSGGCNEIDDYVANMFAVNLKTRQLIWLTCLQGLNKKCGHSLTPINNKRLVEWGGFFYSKSKRIDLNEIIVYDISNLLDNEKSMITG